MVEILHAVREFYALQLMDSLRHPNNCYEKWLRDFGAYKSQYNKQFANMLYDYTVLAVAGEMRHGGRQSEYYNPNVPIGGSRSSAMEYAKGYTPQSVLEAGKSLFEDGGWHDSSFGGDAWADIACVGLTREDVGDVIFIDSCVYLSHNGSFYFDKTDAGIFCILSVSDYGNFLNQKRHYSPEQLVADGCLRVSVELLALIKRGVYLGILPQYLADIRYGSSKHDDDICRVFQYEPVQWGFTALPDELIHSSVYLSHFEDGEDDDDDDDAWEEEDVCGEEEEAQEEETYEEAEKEMYLQTSFAYAVVKYGDR